MRRSPPSWGVTLKSIALTPRPRCSPNRSSPAATRRTAGGPTPEPVVALILSIPIHRLAIRRGLAGLRVADRYVGPSMRAPPGSSLDSACRGEYTIHWAYAPPCDEDR